MLGNRDPIIIDTEDTSVYSVGHVIQRRKVHGHKYSTWRFTIEQIIIPIKGTNISRKNNDRETTPRDEYAKCTLDIHYLIYLNYNFTTSKDKKLAIHDPNFRPRTWYRAQGYLRIVVTALSGLETRRRRKI